MLIFIKGAKTYDIDWTCLLHYFQHDMLRAARPTASVTHSSGDLFLHKNKLFSFV